MEYLTMKEIQSISKLIPTFIKMCENDLEEDEHIIKKPLTYVEYEKINMLITKLVNCNNYVNQDIFK